MKERFPAEFAATLVPAPIHLDMLHSAVETVLQDYSSFAARLILPPKDADNVVVVRRSAQQIANIGLLLDTAETGQSLVAKNTVRGAFYAGTMAGLLMGRNLFPKVSSVQFCLQQLINELKCIELRNESITVTRDNSELFLIENGAYGMSRVFGAREMFTGAVTDQFADSRQRLMAIAGCGIGILIYQESAGHDAAAAMDAHARELRYADDETIGAEIATLPPDKS